MKQCAHCGWDTSQPIKISLNIRTDFDIKINLCPECFKAYEDGTINENKSPVR
jgi:hypothetical protein